MIASRTAALTGAAACGNDSVVRDILQPRARGRSRAPDGVASTRASRRAAVLRHDFAILNDRLTTVDLLLSLGADPTIADGSRKEGHATCASCHAAPDPADRILARPRRGGEVDVVLEARDALARCPHHLAASKGRQGGRRGDPRRLERRFEA